MSERIDVIATSISGSIKDWGKVKRIEPLFKEHGYDDVSLCAVDSHLAAREESCKKVREGGRVIISAGGSGTFNAVMEGCCDSGVALSEIRLGFLRKGSADLIGKVLEMPDDIDEAIAVFAESIRENRFVPCDVILATSEGGDVAPRRFVGYGGTEIFGEIPGYTENRFMKYYKGIFGQLFGDMGPFFLGASLASTAKIFRGLVGRKHAWEIEIDGLKEARGRYQAMMIVNGDLGPNMPMARGAPLGSGVFHLFAIRDLGILKIPGQFRKAWKADVSADAEKWGFESFQIKERLRLVPNSDRPFSVNTDGSTMICQKSATFRICDQLRLISR